MPKTAKKVADPASPPGKAFKEITESKADSPPPPPRTLPEKASSSDDDPVPPPSPANDADDSRGDSALVPATPSGPGTADTLREAATGDNLVARVAIQSWSPIAAGEDIHGLAAGNGKGKGKGKSAPVVDDDSDDDVVPLMLPGMAQAEYKQQEKFATTDLQLAALRRLRALDADRKCRFTTEQAFELVRWIEKGHAIERKKEEMNNARNSGDRFDWQPCSIFCGVAVTLLVVWMMFVGFASLSVDIVVKNGGALADSSSDKLIGTTSLVTQHSFSSLLTLPEKDLRRIDVCTLPHRGGYLVLRVASVVRKPGDVQIISPERSVLRISAGAQVSLERPFGASEVVDFSKQGYSWLPNDPSAVGCTLAIATAAPPKRSYLNSYG